jgi:tetratricopeptide (TPR) repeat protein
MHVWPWKLLALAVWATPIVLFGWRGGLQQVSTPSRLVTVPLACFVAVILVAGALSPYRELSLIHVWPTLGAAAYLLWLYNELSRGSIRRTAVAATLAGAGVLLTLASLLQWWWGPGSIDFGARNEAPFGHSTYTAGALVLVLPWIALQAVRHTGPARLGWTLGGLVAGIVLVTTSSRGGMVAILVSGCGAAAWCLWKAPWSRQRKGAVMGVLSVAAVLAIFSNERLRDLVLTGQWSAVAEESNQQRVAMMRAGLLIGQEHPFLGWGPGTVPLRYPHVRHELEGGVDNVLQLHNLPIQLWATVGFAGLLCGTLLMVGLLASVMRRRIRGDAVTIAAGTSLGGYSLFALTDHQLDVPFIALAAATAAALWLHAAREAAPPSPTAATSRRWRHAMTALLVVVVAVPAWPTVKDVFARRAYAHEQWDGTVAWMPRDAYYRHQAASRMIVARVNASTPEVRTARTRDAANWLRAALAEAQGHEEYAHFNLGWLLLDLGVPTEAAQHFQAAARFAPNRGGLFLGWALALLQADQPEAAIRALALESLNDPGFAFHPLLHTGLAPSLPQWRAELDRLAAENPALKIRTDWILWWSGVNTDASTLEAFSESSAEFLRQLPHIRSKAPLPAMTHRWARLYEAWRTGHWEQWTQDADWASRLASRAAQYPDSFTDFLRCELTRDGSLQLATWRVRPGSGMHAFHPDGPPLVDAYILQTNRLVTGVAAELLPPRGALTPRHLLELAP